VRVSRRGSIVRQKVTPCMLLCDKRRRMSVGKTFSEVMIVRTVRRKDEFTGCGLCGENLPSTAPMLRYDSPSEDPMASTGGMDVYHP